MMFSVMISVQSDWLRVVSRLDISQHVYTLLVHGMVPTVYNEVNKLLKCFPPPMQFVNCIPAEQL